MKTIGIYPGTFQPPTQAHFQSYRKLRRICGPDTFVVTTDRVPTPEAPLNFGDKEQIWVRHGVPSSHVIKVNDWKYPDEIFNNFSSTHTRVIFALNQKDVDELSRKKGKLGQVKPKGKEPLPIDEEITNSVPVDGDPIEKDREIWLDSQDRLSYFQPYVNEEISNKPFSEHGYVIVVDDGRIEGKPISTANIRQVLGSNRYSDDEKKKFFGHVFGWFDIGLYSLMTSKFKLAHQVSPDEEPVEPMPSMTSMIGRNKVQPTIGYKPNSSITQKSGNVKNKLQQMVREILGEMMNEYYSTTVNEPESTSDMAQSLDTEKSPAEQRADDVKRKIDLSKQKTALQKKDKMDKNKLKYDMAAVDVARKITLKQNKEKEQELNKQIANPSSIS